MAIVCIVYLAVEDTPSHLRYLLQRVRERLPKSKLLVGLWRADDPAATDAAVARELGADLLFTSLGSAVEPCVAEARSQTSDALIAA